MLARIIKFISIPVFIIHKPRFTECRKTIQIVTPNIKESNLDPYEEFSVFLDYV